VRKTDRVDALWTQTTTNSEEEYLLKIIFRIADGKLEQVRALLD